MKNDIINIEETPTTFFEILKDGKKAENSIILFENLNQASPAILDKLAEIINKKETELLLPDGSKLEKKPSLKIICIIDSDDNNYRRDKLPISLIRLSLYYVLKNMSEENMKDIIAVKFKNSKISNEKNKVENVFFEVKKICEENNIKNPLNLTSSNLFENFKNLTIPQKIKLMSNNVQRLKEIIFSTIQDCKIFKLDKKKKL